jgi:hypothetical protein
MWEGFPFRKGSISWPLASFLFLARIVDKNVQLPAGSFRIAHTG